MNVCVLTNIPQFIEPPANENFIRIFSEYMDRYQNHKESVKSCRGETFIMFNENLVSYFPDRVYDGIENLAETIINLLIAVLPQ